jgi:hypothetical protein
MVLLDSWALLRLLLHFMHPRSPLSSPALTRGAFFCESAPEAEVISCHEEMSVPESMLWPSSMMRPFVNIARVLSHVGDLSRPANERVLILAGGNDKLMRPPIMRKAARLYEGAYEEVSGSGHHMMRDVYWEDAANKLLGFVNS